jgi:hypothetical protein
LAETNPPAYLSVNGQKRFIAVTPEEISERFKNSFQMRETKENLKREKKTFFNSFGGKSSFS